MKRKRFTEPQIVFALQQADSGTPAAEICRKMGVSENTFYRWHWNSNTAEKVLSMA